MSPWWEGGRAPLQLIKGDDDYSGKDFESVYLARSNDLSHAFFNGASFTNTVFVDAALDQCEFAEAQFTDALFIGADLSGSDFVRASFKRTRFENCNFTDGEWRESTFTEVIFTRCNFSHTTINLCEFNNCEFVEGSIRGLNYKAVNYNVFSRCKFDEPISNEYVLSRNFGLPSAGGASSVLVSAGPMTLEQVCFSSSTSPVRVLHLVEAIETECNTFHGRLKRLRVEFMANIVTSLASERKISPSSIIYVEELFARLAKSTTEESDFRAAMSALINVRNALFREVTEPAPAPLDVDLDAPCSRIVIEFDHYFSAEEVAELVGALDEVAADGHGHLLMASHRAGSTIVEIVLTSIVSMALILRALSFLVAQANVLVTRMDDLKKSVRKLTGTAAKRKENKARKPQPKLPAIMRAGAVLPELAPVQRTVQKRGKRLVKLDEPAKVSLHY